jgi:glutamine amidotransferase
LKTAIIKYNAGNVFSVQCALRRIGADSVITDNPEEIAAADKVIFPGVGEASTAMRYLTEHRLDELIKGLRQPVLGICIGLQLLCRSSEEGNTKCIGIFDVDVKRFDNKDKPELKIPQMGWNTIEVKPNQLIEPKLDGSYVYFVHSYYAPLSKYTIAVTDYIQPYSAALHRDNFFATQFHPEKSGSVGEIILKKFMEL